MGIVLDTNVFIEIERHACEINFSAWADYGEAFISVIACSELLVGAHKANTPERRQKRATFVESLFVTFPILEFDLETARVHAELLASLPRNVTVGAHDLLIGATAIRHGFPVLTTNVGEFSRIPGLTVLEYPVSKPK
jgi:tRNA(fMet)-specific endonuclease VapC